MFRDLKVKIASVLASIWIRSLRVKVEVPEGYGPGILGIWHRDLLACCAAFKDMGVRALVSQSGDGEFFAATAARLGYVVFRGSDTRGSSNIRYLLSALKEGAYAGMALDGPHGPAGEAKPGSLWLSKKSGCPLWKIQVTYGAHFTLKSWDKFVVPLPMSAIVVKITYFCGE